jgi:hypothetical protein
MAVSTVVNSHSHDLETEKPTRLYNNAMHAPPNQPYPVLNYYSMRRAIGVLGFCLPLTVALGGYFVFQIGLKDTISDYYHSGMRDVFVGLMTSIAVFLYCYTGYSVLDNFLTNFAGLAALGLAFFPTDESLNRTLIGTIHLLSALVFFLTLALISLIQFPRSSSPLGVTPKKKTRNIVYILCGITMIICLIAIGVLKWNVNDERFAFVTNSKPVFWLESLAVWAFALSWLVKGQAILKDHATDPAQQSPPQTLDRS